MGDFRLLRFSGGTQHSSIHDDDDDYGSGGSGLERTESVVSGRPDDDVAAVSSFISSPAPVPAPVVPTFTTTVLVPVELLPRLMQGYENEDDRTIFAPPVLAAMPAIGIDHRDAYGGVLID